MVAALMCHGILILVWMTPILAEHRRKLLLAAVILGRFALSELETTGNTMLVLNNEVTLPLGLTQALGLSLQTGGYVSWFSSISTLLAALLLMKLLPRELREKDWAGGNAPLSLKVVQGLAAVVMIAGVCVWWFCDFLHAVTGGLAGALIDPASYSASQLGQSDAAMRAMIILTALVCPIGHVAAFFLAMSGKAPCTARVIAGLSATFCLLDLFAIGLLASFLEGVGGFAFSAIHGLAPQICDFSEQSLDEACLTIKTRALPLGTGGLLAATAAWGVLCSIQAHSSQHLGRLYF